MSKELILLEKSGFRSSPALLSNEQKGELRFYG